MRQLLYGKKGKLQGWFAVNADDTIEYVPTSREAMHGSHKEMVEEAVGKPFRAISIGYASERKVFYTCNGIRLILVKQDGPPNQPRCSPVGLFTTDAFAAYGGPLPYDPPFHAKGEGLCADSVTGLLKSQGYVWCRRIYDGIEFFLTKDKDGKADADKYYIKGVLESGLNMDILVRSIDVSCAKFEVVRA